MVRVRVSALAAALAQALVLALMVVPAQALMVLVQALRALAPKALARIRRLVQEQQEQQPPPPSKPPAAPKTSRQMPPLPPLALGQALARVLPWAAVVGVQKQAAPALVPAMRQQPDWHRRGYPPPRQRLAGATPLRTPHDA